MPVFDLEAYKLKLKAAGVPDDVIAEVDTGIKPGFMRQDDYSRITQQSQREHTQAMSAVQAKYGELVEYENSIRNLEQTYGPREQWPQAFAQQIANQNPSGSGQMTPSGLTAADLQREVNRMRDELRTAIRHRNR